MLCPACTSTIALVVAGTTSSAGVSALAVRFWRRAHRTPAAPLTPGSEPDMERPAVVSRAEWLAARKELLAREKEATRQRDALGAARRALPMVPVDKRYDFDGPDGTRTLRELFGAHRQLVVYHFMFAPAWDEGCKSCTYVMDNVSGALPHLAAADTAFAAISRAPLAKLEAYRARMGWTFPWLSSGESDFNYDFHATLDEARGSVEYNYESVAELVRRGEVPPTAGDMPAFSVFFRDGDAIFHTYSTYQRGVDQFLNTYNLLDLTPLGRNERTPMAWVRRRHQYGA